MKPPNNSPFGSKKLKPLSNLFNTIGVGAVSDSTRNSPMDQNIGLKMMPSNQLRNGGKFKEKRSQRTNDVISPTQ